MKKIYDNKKLIILISCIVLLIVFLLSFINKEENDEEEISFNTITKINETTTKEKESFYVDIKGEVNKPGVYEIKDNYTIQNIINDAGGLKTNAYTKNINLSKKVRDEMVIYIFSKKEIKELESIKYCNCEVTYKYLECEDYNVDNLITTQQIITTTLTTTTLPITSTSTTQKVEKTTKNTTSQITTTKIEDEKKLININTGTLNELLTIVGLGEKKAQAIIDYRNEFGLFKNLEEIKNVKGIGVSTFEKIKNYIEI